LNVLLIEKEEEEQKKLFLYISLLMFYIFSKNQGISYFSGIFMFVLFQLSARFTIYSFIPK